MIVGSMTHGERHSYRRFYAKEELTVLEKRNFKLKMIINNCKPFD
jgi:hypothetical protein